MVGKTKKIVVLNDVHVPNHDKKACRAVFEFLKDFRPHEVILNGDIADFESVARFEKSLQVENSLLEEIESVKDFLHDIQYAVGKKCGIFYVIGNHEQRMSKYLTRYARGLSRLKQLTVPALLNLKAYNIHWVGDRYLIRDGVMYSHLDKASHLPGSSSKSIGIKHTVDVIHGHVHSVAMMKLGNFTFIDNGCLCEIQQKYITGPSTFKQAFTVIHRTPAVNQNVPARNHYQLIPVEKGSFRYGDKEYRG